MVMFLYSAWKMKSVDGLENGPKSRFNGSEMQKSPKSKFYLYANHLFHEDWSKNMSLHIFVSVKCRTQELATQSFSNFLNLIQSLSFASTWR